MNILDREFELQIIKKVSIPYIKLKSKIISDDLKSRSTKINCNHYYLMINMHL